MQKVIGELSIRAIIAKNVLLGKQSRLYSGFSRFYPVASSSSAVFPFNYQVVKTLYSSALTNGVQIFAMRKESSDSSASVDHNESFIDTNAKLPLWEYLLKHPPKNVYAEMDHTFCDLLREGKMQLRFLIPRDTVESLASAGDEFLNCLGEHGASLEITDWKVPEGVLTLVCPLDKVTECFKKIFPKIGGDAVRLLFHASYSSSMVGPRGSTRKELLKQKKLKPDQFFFYKITCPHSTDRVCQLKGDEETMLYFLDHIMDALKQNPRNQIEVPFNKQSRVGALVEEYGGFEPDYSKGSLEDGNVTVRFSIPRDLFALIKNSDGDYCIKSIRKVSGAVFKAKNPNDKRVLTSLKVVGLPVQVEQVCYMLKQGLEMTEGGKDYLRGEWKDPEGDHDDDDG